VFVTGIGYNSPVTLTGKAVMALVATAALVLSGCGGSPSDGGPSRKATAEVVEVPADAETQPMQHSGDAADDPALWVNKSDPAKSLVIGNDKQGALETYNLDGTLVQRITGPSNFWGNVDVKQDVPLGTGSTDVVAVANDGVRLYAVDPSTRKLSPITANGAPLDTLGGEGVCLYKNPAGDLSVFMVFISGAVGQFALNDDGTGQLSAKKVRAFKVGSEAEGCVVDDQNKALYISEENVGLWKYDADPAGGEKRTMVDEVKPKGHQIADIEGVTLVDDGEGKGLVIASSQGQAGQQSFFAVFDRKNGNYLGSFRIVDGHQADGCSHTDGVTATSEPLGSAFPRGVFICQDNDNTTPGQAGNQDFKLTRLEKVRP
jgi:3-phytase